MGSGRPARFLLPVRRDQLDLAAMVIMVALCIIWGVNQVAIKAADGGISPILQAGLRSSGAALLLWAWSRRSGARLLPRDGTLGLGVLIAVLFTGEFVFLFWGLVFTQASRAVLFLYTAPFVVAIGGHAFIPGERLRSVQFIGLILAFLGIAIAFSDALRLPTHREMLGDVMTLTAAIFWGATTLVIRGSRLSRVSPSATLFYQLAGSALLLLPLSWAMGEPGIVALTPMVLAALAYQTLLVAGVSYLTWFWLIARYPAFKLSAFSFLTPIFGMIAGNLLLAEPITTLLAAAMVLVAAGIYLVNYSPLRPG